MTARMTTRLTAALGLVFALSTAACSDGFGLTEPIAAPAFSQNGHDSYEGREASRNNKFGDEKLLDAESWDGTSWDEVSWDEVLDEVKDWMLVESDLKWSASRASATIGRNGGTLTLWAHSTVGGGWQPYHSLTVPPGTVRKPTHFVMELGADPAIDVHLSATEITTGRRITEFSNPLTLKLTYAGSAHESADTFTIVHMVDGEVSETVMTVQDADQECLAGEIWHFSRYAVATE